MAWRFQASKFKNTTPKLPKKEETIFDLPVGTLSCTNNGIQSNEKFLAFHIEGEGGKLGVVRSDARGRRTRNDISVVCAHNDQVDDFCFLPYEEDILVTCARDERVKVWSLGEGATLRGELDGGAGRLLSSLSPHPTASSILGMASTSNACVVDVERMEMVLHLEGVVDKALSSTWTDDGMLYAVSSDKGRQAQVWDPRASPLPSSHSLHSGMGREARVLFAGNKLVSTGFTNKRIQEVRMFDTRAWDKPLFVSEYTATTGVLIPQYDPDTKLLFLGGKGTNKIFLTELQDRAPAISPVFELNCPEQLLGFSLAPKRTVNVMEGEVARLYQLTKTSILPIPCIVPRRSYRELHMDLFPETLGPSPGCGGAAWLSGCNHLPEKVSLVPDKKPDSPPPQEPIPSSNGTGPPPPALSSGTGPQPPVLSATPRTVSTPSAKPVQMEAPAKENGNDAIPRVDAVRMREEKNSIPRTLSVRERPKSTVVGQVQSKYRHVDTKAGIKAGAIFTNLRNVNTRLPNECNGMGVSTRYAAVPLAGPAGIIQVLPLDEPTKLPDGVIDGLYNKALVTDLQWSPFDPSVLAVGTDSGVVNVWRVGEGPLAEQTPEKVLRIGGEKILILRWNPVASDILAIGLSDNSIEIWDVSACLRSSKFVSHSSQLLSLCWSMDGSRMASLAKDLELHVFRPRETVLENRAEGAIESPRAARVLFACDDSILIVAGFTKSSGRQLHLYDAGSLSPLHRFQVDSAVQPLVPHYDADSSVLSLSGKGDRTLLMFQVCPSEPFLLPLAPFTAAAGHQSIAFHHKNVCNVMEVEFQRAWRLTEKTLELLKFFVPRVKKDLFQSDLFPDALVTWLPVLSASEWLSGKTASLSFVSLCPDGVHSLHPAQPAAPRLATRQEVAVAADKAPSRTEVADSWSATITEDCTLEQDKMEGVPEAEWTE